MRCTGSEAYEAKYPPDQHFRRSAVRSHGGVLGRTTVGNTYLAVSVHGMCMAWAPWTISRRMAGPKRLRCWPGVRHVRLHEADPQRVAGLDKPETSKEGPCAGLSSRFGEGPVMGGLG